MQRITLTFDIEGSAEDIDHFVGGPLQTGIDAMKAQVVAEGDKIKATIRVNRSTFFD